jgi:membrane-associated phospholipid phosphatase
LAQKADGLQKLDDNVQRKVSARFTGRTYVDDYTQYVPIAAVFGLDLTGMKATHNLRDRTFLAASSFLFSSVCVQSLKRTMRVARPDGSNNKSFPSGHTATTFAGAHLLFKEYKDVSPWIGVAGYIIATGTGALRIRNQKHWVSDVVAGAGFGIISVEASYLLLPVFQHITGVKDTRTNLSIAPMIGFYQYGIGLAYTF